MSFVNVHFTKWWDNFLKSPTKAKICAMNFMSILLHRVFSLGCSRQMWVKWMLRSIWDDPEPPSLVQPQFPIWLTHYATFEQIHCLLAYPLLPAKRFSNEHSCLIKICKKKAKSPHISQFLYWVFQEKWDFVRNADQIFDRDFNSNVKPCSLSTETL